MRVVILKACSHGKPGEVADVTPKVGDNLISSGYARRASLKESVECVIFSGTTVEVK